VVAFRGEGGFFLVVFFLGVVWVTKQPQLEGKGGGPEHARGKNREKQQGTVMGEGDPNAGSCLHRGKKKGENNKNMEKGAHRDK